MSIKRVAVLTGGWSHERDVSLRSGQNVANVLKNMGLEVLIIDVKRNLRDLTDALYDANPDFILNMLHGKGGEDGIIQGVLEIFGVPYSGSNVLSSAIAFNKEITKTLVKSVGVNVADGFCISANELKFFDSKTLKYPVVLKPADNGSSIGISIIKNAEEFKIIQSKQWTYGGRILVEKFIEGKDYTVLVMNGKVIGDVEINYQNEFYDYDAKYSAGGSSHNMNHNMPNVMRGIMYSYAVKAYNACLCSEIARVDFRYNDALSDYTKLTRTDFKQEEYLPCFLEINTQPGMTETSLVPDILKSKKISMEEYLRKTLGLNG